MKPMTKFSQFICTEESRSESKFYKKICKTDVEQLLISHFLRNSTSESAAAFLPHVRLGLYFIRQRCDTDSNVEFLACRILFMHYFNVMSMHKFGPAKLAILVPVQPEHTAKQTAALSSLHHLVS